MEIENLISVTGLVGIAIFSQIYGSALSIIHIETDLKRSRKRAELKKSQSTELGNPLQETDEDNDWSSLIGIDKRTAILLPAAASVSLLLFYYLFDTMSFVVSLWALVFVSQAIAFATKPFVYKYFPRLKKVRVPTCNKRVFNTQILCCMGVEEEEIDVELSGSGGSNGVTNGQIKKIIGTSFCVMMISLINLKSFKIGTILLSGLFFYDIFWVYFSGYFFTTSGNTNVMENVATKTSQNPVYVLAQVISTTKHWHLIETLQLPNKLVWHHSILGLGDIVLPGLVLAYLKKWDTLMGKAYWVIGILAYAVGLVLAVLVGVWSRAGQPALLFIVPVLIGMVMGVAAWRGEAKEMWNSELKKGGCCDSGEKVECNGENSNDKIEIGKNY